MNQPFSWAYDMGRIFTDTAHGFLLRSLTLALIPITGVPGPYPTLSQPHRRGRILPKQTPLADIAARHGHALVPGLVHDRPLADPAAALLHDSGHPPFSLHGEEPPHHALVSPRYLTDAS